MNGRQEHALLNPLNEAHGDITPYREIYQLPSKLLIVSILAVDR